MRFKKSIPAVTFLIFFIAAVVCPADTYLIWDPCQQASADAFSDVLASENYSGIITADIYPYLENLAAFKPLIFFPECFDDPDIENVLIDIQDEIGSYLNDGGSLYWEGADIALSNDYYRDGIFSFDMAICNTEPFTELYGSSESFETLAFSTSPTYAAMIDGGDGCAFASIVNCPHKAVFRDGLFRAMLTSFPFSCINDQGQNNRADYVNTIMGWLTGLVDVPEQDAARPDEYAFIKAFPNPFNVQTTIIFNLPRAGDIKIRIYNILGQPVVTLFEGYRDAGEHDLIWNGDNNSTGIYFARLENTRYTECVKLILLK